MTSKAAKRARKRKITLPGGEQVDQPRKGLPRIHAVPREAPEDAKKTALEARKRIYGGSDAKAAERACESVLGGSDVGRCILALHPSPQAHLPIWDTWQSLCAAIRNYRTRIIGMTGDPQGAAIAMIPDEMHTDPSLTVDLRSAEEKDEAAKRRNEYWRGMMDALPLHQRWAVREAVNEFSGAPLWRDGLPTALGLNAVAGLVAMGKANTR